MKGGNDLSRRSRWDALRSDDNQSSLSSKGRRRQLNLSQDHTNGSFPTSSSSTSWRRRSQTNESHRLKSRTPRSAEEERVRKAIDNLQRTTNEDFDDYDNDDSNAGTITELDIALFGNADEIYIESLPQSNQIDAAIPIKMMSNRQQWEVVHSLLQILSQSTIRKSLHKHLISCIARNASVCLHLLSSDHASARVSDLQIGESVMILVELLQRDENLSTKSNGYNDLQLKSSLLQCVAKLLVVSAIHGENAKNTREGRAPLRSWGAEKVVTLIIKDNALPFIEELICNNDDALTISMKSTYSHGAVECITALLIGANDDVSKHSTTIDPKSFQASKHAAAMLSELVVDVMPDGKENLRINPLRVKLLKAMNAIWRWTCDTIQRDSKATKSRTHGLEITLLCLTSMLDTMHAFERGVIQKRQRPADASEINVSAIIRDIKTLLEMERLKTIQQQILRMLTSLCLTYPVTTANHWHLFLDKTSSSQPLLLTTIQKGVVALKFGEFDNSSWILLPDVLKTISSLISSIPFTNWISSNGRLSTRMSGGNFATRVRNAMLMLMTHLKNLVVAVKEHISEVGSLQIESVFESVMMQSASIVAKLCTLLPFNDVNSTFTVPAVNLVQCAGDIFTLSARALEPEGSSRTMLTSAMVHFSRVFTTISDGSATVSLPVKHWLSGTSSYNFLATLLNDSYSSPTLSSASKCKLEMLTSIAKSAPWSITREPFNFALFLEICTSLCNIRNDSSRRLLGVKLMEAFIVGRKVYVMTCTSKDTQHNDMELAAVPGSFCPLLQSALADESSAVRTCAVTSFGSLLVTDWVALLSPGSSNDATASLDWTHIDSILKMCNLIGEKNGNVRSAACKAVGDICTVCVGSLLSEELLEKKVPFSDNFVVAISTKVCNVMENSLRDGTVTVRTMALFAIGNMSLALKERCAFLSMHRMLPLVYTCISDKDDKVVGNAIRTIGHVSYFVYTPEFLSKKGGTISEDLKLYCSLLSNLTTKVRVVLCDASGETSRELSWKQRNNAKKHAWGAATTIGILLGHNHLLSHYDDSLVESALSQLFRCIELHAFINEKIFAAAVNALSTLPISLWKYTSTKKCEIISLGLAKILNFLQSPQRKVNSAYETKVESVASALVEISCKRDFCQLFLLRENFPFSIDFFYQWLLSHQVHSSTLEEVVAAVSSKEVELVVDVSDIQILLSRTAQHNQAVHQVDSTEDATSDNEDEL